MLVHHLVDQRRSRRRGSRRGCARGSRSPSRARAARARPCRARSRAGGRGSASAARRSSCAWRAPSPGGTSGRAGGTGPRSRGSRPPRQRRACARSAPPSPRSRPRSRAPRRAAPRAARAGGAPRARRPPRSRGSPGGSAAGRAGPARRRRRCPPDWPRRTSSTPASTSILTASRSVGRLMRMMPGELALGGQPVAHVQVAGLDPLGDLLDRLLEGTARRDGLERALQTSLRISARWSPRRYRLAGGLHALERLALGHLDRRDAVGLGGLERASRAAPWRRRSGSRLAPGAPVAVPLARDVDQAAAVGEEVRARRRCRAASACAPRARSVSGLFAAPATTRQSIERASASSISPPAAQGASTSSSLARIASADGATAMPVLVGEPLGSARRRGRSRSRARRRVRELAPPAPSPPCRARPRRRGARRSRPSPSRPSRPRRIAWKTVSAVTGEGSPPPPFGAERPDHVAREAGHVVHVRGGGADVLGGDVGAVEAVDHARRAPRAARRAAPRRPSSIITALPPPRSRPAADAFSVIVRASPITSSSASRSPPG